MAISGIVNDLIGENYIKEVLSDENMDIPRKTGRNPVILKISDRSINAIGIYIRRYEVHCVISDIKGEIFYHKHKTLPKNADNEVFLAVIYSLMDEAIEKNKEYYISEIGIASIGPLDIYGKRLFYPPNFYQI